MEDQVKQYTAQESFSIVVNHLLTQGATSEAIDNTGEHYCAYRGPDGRKCAIGILIADEHYSPALEKQGIRRARAVVMALEESGHAAFLYHCSTNGWGLAARLQTIHDTSSVEYWREDLEAAAREFGLEMP